MIILKLRITLKLKLSNISNFSTRNSFVAFKRQTILISIVSPFIHVILTSLRSNALSTTLTLLTAIMAPATIGLSKPSAANGIPTTL